jgi:PAS domain S-box-containing protein
MADDRPADEIRRLRERLGELERAEQTSPAGGPAPPTDASLYTVLVEQSIQGVCIHQDFVIRFANATAARLAGHARGDDIVGRDLRDWLPPHERLRLQGYAAARLRGDPAPARYEFQAIRDDGQMFWIEPLVSLVSWRGEPALAATFLDVTGRKHAEEALQATEAHFRSMVASALDVMFLLDAGGVVRYASASALRVLGRAPAGLLGRPLVEILHPDDVGHLVALLARELDAQGRVEDLTFQLRHQDGSWRLFEGVVTNLASDLRMAGLVVTARDVTSRRRLEEDLARRRDALNQAERLAGMGQLLAGIAHQLANPLSVVLGHSDLLCRELPPGRLAERASHLAEAAARCATVVRQFLALGRRRPAEGARVRMNQVLREAVELLGYGLQVDGVEVRWQLDEALPDVWGDPHGLHQIAVILVANAGDAVRGVSRPRWIALRTRAAPDRSRVIVEVRDNGIGIPEEVRPRIFRPFLTTKVAGQGAGLGLSLARSIVEAHGGSIAFETEVGQGTAFTLEIPVGTPPAPAETPASAEPAVGEGRRILVVDDDPATAAVMADVLALDGHRADVAFDARHAVERLGQAGDYALVICDITMPGPDGPELYREVVRRFPQLAQRFVFLTGDVAGQERSDFTDAIGAVAVPKPLDPDQLREAVRRALG